MTSVTTVVKGETVYVRNFKCDYCNKRLPLFFGRKKRFNGTIWNKETKIGKPIRFCSQECVESYAKENDVEIY